MVGHPPDSRVVVIYKIAGDKMACESGFCRALCSVKSIEKRET